MDYSKISDSSNNVNDLAKLKKKLKQWKKQSNSSSTTITTTSKNNNGSKKGSLSRSNSIKEKITFIRRTLSFNDISTTSVSNVVPKGFLAVHIGEEMKRFVIPTNYLSHQAFSGLLKEAEEEFGFQQEGILRIPCEVRVFECILKVVEVKSKSLQNSKETVFSLSRSDGVLCGSVESQGLSHWQYPSSPMCR